MTSPGSTVAYLKPYPAYKDSGVPWLGKVPEHWEVRQLGRIGRLTKGNGGSKEDNVAVGVPCIRYGDIYMHYRYNIQRSFSSISPERTQDYTPIKYGNVLFAGSGETLEEIGKSAVNLIKSEAYCGGDVILFCPTVDVDPWFLGYASDCYSSAVQKSLMGRGFTVKHIYGDQLKYLWIVLPPRSEQSAIVRYLNHEDLQIRQYIRAKQKLIKLLEEQKQAIIQQAVAGGLDPNVRLKPSGVEWLGDVPEHWEMRRLKTIARMQSGEGITGLSINENDTYPVYGGNGLRGYTSRFTHEGDYILVGRQGALCGNVHYAHGQFWASEHAVVASLFPGNELVWYGELLKILNLRQYSMAAAQPGLAVERIQNLSVPVPPKEEQCAIARYIESATAPISDVIAQTRSRISLLREYRSRLIADVVTGKLDVREAASGLPMDVGEPEFLGQAGDEAEMDEAKEIDEPNVEPEDAST